MGIVYTKLPKGAYKQPKRDTSFRPYKPDVNPLLAAHQAQMATMPSKDNGGVALVAQPKSYEDPELAKRELEARTRVHTVAPICNKGGYQLITAEEDLKTVGRKV